MTRDVTATGVIKNRCGESVITGGTMGRSKVAYASSLRRESLPIGIKPLDLRIMPVCNAMRSIAGRRKLEACAPLAASPPLSLNRISF